MPIQRLSNAGQSGYRYKSLIAGITPVASIPTIGTATALTYSTASVTFTAPGAYGATTFTATSSPGGFTGTSATSPITVSGLSEQTAYTFTVTATNATGTSRPSSASNSITTPTAFSPDSGYDSLASVTLSASTSTITFSGIPSGYKHLQLRILARATYAPSDTGGILNFNGDSGANYAWHRIYGDGSAATAGGNASATFARIDRMTGGSSTANAFGVMIVDILDYANTSKYKTMRSLGGYDGNGSGWIGLNSSVWMNTSAIASITYANADSTNLVQYTQASLYGVK